MDPISGWAIVGGGFMLSYLLFLHLIFSKPNGIIYYLEWLILIILILITISPILDERNGKKEHHRLRKEEANIHSKLREIDNELEQINKLLGNTDYDYY